MGRQNNRALRLHPLLLTPLQEEFQPQRQMHAFYQWLDTQDPQQVLKQLDNEHCSDLWFEYVHQLPYFASPTWQKLYSQRRQQAIAKSLGYQHILEKMRRLFSQHQIPWLIFKGAHWSRVFYPQPHCRPAVDIDILIHPESYHQVQSLLIQHGFSNHSHPWQPAYQSTFKCGTILIDLHWALMRPGRSAIDLSALCMQQRVWHQDLPVPSPTMSLVIALLHPALTEHVTDKLIKAWDVQQAIKTWEHEWRPAVALLQKAHLCNAAWSMLTWAQQWFPNPAVTQKIKQLQPSPLRQYYLQWWLNKDPAKLYQVHPSLVRLGFGLALQDDLYGICRSIASLYQSTYDARLLTSQPRSQQFFF